MARIVIADDGIEFDGRRAAAEAVGGAEGAVAGLAEGFAACGHEVFVHNRCAAPLDYRGVAWRPIGAGLPQRADLYVANRAPALLGGVEQAGHRAFWVHNPASYLLKLRHLKHLWRWRPTLVFLGAWHASGYPPWAPGRRVTIPLGLPQDFRGRDPATSAPPARALFTSNPLRSLDWLLDLWRDRIRPAVPAAELHVFAGPSPYGAVGAAKAPAMRAVLEKAAALRPAGVVPRAPVPRAELAAEMASARVLLYRGDAGETFCLAAAEAQAMGLPVVTEGIGSLRERVRNGETGFVARGEAAFAAAAVRLLEDDALWAAQHRAALATQRGFSWEEIAVHWERVLSLRGGLPSPPARR